MPLPPSPGGYTKPLSKVHNLFTLNSCVGNRDFKIPDFTANDFPSDLEKHILVSNR